MTKRLLDMGHLPSLNLRNTIQVVDRHRGLRGNERDDPRQVRQIARLHRLAREEGDAKVIDFAGEADHFALGVVQMTGGAHDRASTLWHAVTKIRSSRSCCTFSTGVS